MNEQIQFAIKLKTNLSVKMKLPMIKARLWIKINAPPSHTSLNRNRSVNCGFGVDTNMPRLQQRKRLSFSASEKKARKNISAKFLIENIYKQRNSKNSRRKILKISQEKVVCSRFSKVIFLPCPEYPEKIGACGGPWDIKTY